MSDHCCIVCGKPIAKKTEHIYFRDAHEARPEQKMSWGGTIDAEPARPHGYREGNTIYLDKMPQSRAEAQQWVNHRIVSASRGATGIRSIGYWDGETYQDRYFHAGECAMRQGYASASHGDRFTWPPKS